VLNMHKEAREKFKTIFFIIVINAELKYMF
jgi:hypothetical protein